MGRAAGSGVTHGRHSAASLLGNERDDKQVKCCLLDQYFDESVVPHPSGSVRLPSRSHSETRSGF